jgi:hypothetical protein
MGTSQILPGTGRGTMRSMVEGGLHLHRSQSPLHHRFAAVPFPSRGGSDDD